MDVDILGMFDRFRASVGTITEERSSGLVAKAAEIKAAVAPTIAAYKALAEIAEADADMHEAAGESFKSQAISQVRKLETDAGVLETGIAVQERFQVSQQTIDAVMQRQRQLAAECTAVLRGGQMRSIGAPAQKQLPW